MRFNSYKVLIKYLKDRGYNPKLFYKNSKDPPDPNDQLGIEWYPYDHYRIFGMFDSKSLMYLCLFMTNMSSDMFLSVNFCVFSSYIHNYRECMLYIYKYIENCNIKKILLPFGGIPYYIPANVKTYIFDTDLHIKPYLDYRPNCEYVLGPNINLDRLLHNVRPKIVCCVDFSHKIETYDQFQSYLKLFHKWLKVGSKLILNIIIASDDQQKHNKYHFDVLSGFNKINRRRGFYPTWEQLIETVESNYKIIKVYDDPKIDINYVFILEKI